MSGASLFGRLERNADPNSAGRSVYRGEDLETVVLEHLGRLLNTRAGSAPTAPDYGVVELSELIHDFPDAAAVMQRAIKTSIAKYEPRLKNVQVRPVEGEEQREAMTFLFEVTGQVVYPNGERHSIRLTTSVDSSSNVQIT
ncbi:MAG: type VI secretion system baseplate subunit TssE [Deltaproteobacteria bacterium]|nr:type VI secretion system baseplate subunit TssE [Deltaproteobacteria bacterium]